MQYAKASCSYRLLVTQGLAAGDEIACAAATASGVLLSV
jgi:hypothetical protein